MNVEDAAYAIGQDYPGGCAALGPRMGMTGKMLANKLNPNDALHKLHLLESIRMQVMTGDHRIFYAEANELGYMVNRLPSVDDEDFAQAAMRSIKEFGEFMGVAEEALRDGKVSKNELRRVEKELLDALAHMSKLHQLIAAKVRK